ncbi:MAG: hypothetical protein WCC95_03225 [Candidatus Sulfotelmatobacter sp.]
MSDIDTAVVVDGLKVLDLKRPIREADIIADSGLRALGGHGHIAFVSISNSTDRNFRAVFALPLDASLAGERLSCA